MIIGQGLYAGVSAPLVGVTPMCKFLSIASRNEMRVLIIRSRCQLLGMFNTCITMQKLLTNHQGYGVGKQLVERFSIVHNNQFSVGQVSAAGFFSAIPMTVITAPFERVKIILQIQGQKQLAPGEKPRYSGGLDVVRQLYKDGGIRSVYKGSLMTLARDGPGSAAYFATYEIVKRRLTPKDADGKPGKLSLPAIMAAGGAAGVAMWIPVFPVDTIKSRLQSSEGNLGIMGTVRQLYARGGFKAFFPGMGPAMARAVPANAATFLGVELAHSAMNKTFG